MSRSSTDAADPAEVELEQEIEALSSCPGSPVAPHLSPKELARAIGVSESSLKRWVDSGRIQVVRTAGGHRRIPVNEAVRFIRCNGHALHDSHILGLCRMAEAKVGIDEDFHQALVEGDLSRARDLIIGRYLSGESLASLCDGPIRSAMCRIGALWRDAPFRHGDAGIAVEHIATDICLQIVLQLRGLVSVPAGAPLALGGALVDDPYMLPSMMAAGVLADAGFTAINLGPQTPVAAIASTIIAKKPRIAWISISTDAAAQHAKSALAVIAKAAAVTGSALAIGGSATCTMALPQQRHVVHVKNMGELAAFARALVHNG